MSWLNISGNLTSLANNVTSFTREVLTEAQDESSHLRNSDDEEEETDYGYEAYDHDPVNDENDKQYNGDYIVSEAIEVENVKLKERIGSLQEEVKLLNTELHAKDKQVFHLENENSKIQLDFHKHMENLRSHLLEKEKEIEVLGLKYNETEINHENFIKELLEKQQNGLESTKQSDESKDDDMWTENWGGDLSEEVENLKMQNESLSNEVMMKEIILNSIEEKMKEASGQDFDVADFSTWFEQFVTNTPVNENAKVMRVLRDGLKQSGKSYDAENPSHVEKWLTSIVKQNTALLKKVDEMEKVIADVESVMTDHSNEAFTIEEFEDWLKSVSLQTSTKTNTNATERMNADSQTDFSDAEKILKQIQIEIRELDEEYEHFEISDFSNWLDSMQGRIDDLEVELLNEQESKELEEKQRLVDRAKLEELFNEKQNEIAMLKVELYNKDSVNIQQNAEDSVDGPTVAHLQEQLDEATVRCQGLQEELKCVQKRNVDLSDSQEELSDVLNQHEHFQNELRQLAEDKEKIEAELIVVNKKVELLERELKTEQEDNNKAQEELSNYKISYEHLQIQLEEYANAYSILQQQYYEQQSSYAALEMKYAEANINLAATQDENERLQQEVKEISKAYENASGELCNKNNMVEIVKTKEKEIENVLETIQIVKCIVDKILVRESIEEFFTQSNHKEIFSSLKELSVGYNNLYESEKNNISKLSELSETVARQSNELSNLNIHAAILSDCLTQIGQALDESDESGILEKFFVDNKLRILDPLSYKQRLQSIQLTTQGLKHHKQELMLQIKNLESSSKQAGVSKSKAKPANHTVATKVEQSPAVKKNLLSQYFGGLDETDNSDPFSGTSQSNCVLLKDDDVYVNAVATHSKIVNEPSSQDVLDKENMVSRMQQELEDIVKRENGYQEKLRYYENQNSSLSLDIQEKTNTLEMLRGELEKIKVLLESERLEKCNLQNSYSRISDQLFAKNNLIQELNEHIVETKSMVQTVSTEKNLMESNYTQTLKSLEEQSVELASLRQQSLEYTQLSEEYDNAKHSHESIVEELQEEIERLQNIINDLRRVQSASASAGEDGVGSTGGMKFGILKKKLKELEEKNEHLQSEISILKQGQESELASKEVVFESLLLEVSKALDDLQLNTDDIKFVSAENSLLSLEPSVYLAYIGSIGSILNSLTMERDSLKKRLEEEFRNDEKTCKSSQKESQVVEEVFAVDAVQELNSENSDEWESWGTNFEDMERKASVIEVNAGEGRIESNGDANGETNEKVMALLKNLEEEKETRLSYEKEVNKIKTDMENLESKLKNESKLVKKLRAKLQVSENRAVKQTKSKEEVDDEIKEFKSSIVNLQEMVQLLQHEGGVLQDRLDIKEREIAAEKHERQELTDEIKALKESTIEFERTIENLRKETSVQPVPVTPNGEGGGGVKFGAMKRKIQELETLNSSLEKTIEKFRSESNNEIGFKNISKELADKTAECQYYFEESEQLKSTLLSLQNDMQTIQEECFQLKIMLNEQHVTPTLETSQTNQYSNANSVTQQGQLHTLSLRLTEKTEDCEELQRKCDYLNSRVLELQNDTSDLELIREECKQLKAMLVGKEHESRVDETISMLQTESKQLKNLLIQKDVERQYLQKALLEKENDLSDMELLRGECKQLKQMLISKGENDMPPHYSPQDQENVHDLETSLLQKEEEIRKKDAMIIEMQNSNSDMELLREECRQLKVMLIAKNSSIEANDSTQTIRQLLQQREEEIKEKELAIARMHDSLMEMETIRNESLKLKDMLQNNPSTINGNVSMNMSGMDVTDDFSQNSFLVQVQQLEDLITEKDDEILEKLKEIQNKDATIQEQAITLEKNNYLISQLESKSSDFELLHTECRALKEMIVEKEQMFGELQNDLDSANDALQQKNEELKLRTNELTSTLSKTTQLEEELMQSMAQEDNIHILQTEYRNVEEQHKKMEMDFNECREKLFTAETQLERLRSYEDQYIVLQNLLKQKEESLQTMIEQSTKSSVSENDDLNGLRKELNELKIILRERETRILELSSSLETKSIELQNIYNESKEQMNTLESRLKASQQHVELLNSEKESLEELCNLRLEDECKFKTEIDALKATIKHLENNEHYLETQLRDLQSELDSEKMKCLENANELNNYKSKLEQTQKLVDNSETMMSQEKNDVSAQQTKITELEVELLQMRRKLLNQGKLETNSALQNTSNCMEFGGHQEEMELMCQVISEIKITLNIHDLPTHPPFQQQKSALADLNTIHYSIDQLVQKNATMLNKIENLQSLNLKLKEKLRNQFEDAESSFSKTSEDYEFKIKDLQSQVLELNELETDYKNMFVEKHHLEDRYKKIQDLNEELARQLGEEQKKRAKESELSAEQVVALEEQLQNLQTEYQKRIKESENTANSVVVAECERLRVLLEEHSALHLNKNKECDQLKLDILQLEDKLHKYEIDDDKMKTLEDQLRGVTLLETENIQLKSTIEDYQEQFKSGKKEKLFLEELIQKTGVLEQEKNNLLLQLNQLTSKVKEQDVLLKHKDVNYREVEAKTTRELERLRAHLMMIEENHERDILELKDREAVLQKQLDDSKQVLSRKSLILQDSSKQFQDHVVNLEEQLHMLASQRDTQTLELSKCKEKIQHDAQAIYNLQSALEQLEKEKTEQYDFLTSISKRKEKELEERVRKLTEEQQHAQSTMSEASLAVQGIEKITLELQQKETELRISREKINELVVLLKERETRVSKMMEASDNKLDKSLIRNLLMKYFQAEENKRADIVQVIGGLLDIPNEQIQEIGSGAVASKVGGWISNVWGFATPRKQPLPPTTPLKKYDANQSFSELFVKFLENESENHPSLVNNTASLTLTSDAPVVSTVKMFTPSTPDILAFHNNKNSSLATSQTIPAPGQEIPRVHTHHAQSTLKTLLS